MLGLILFLASMVALALIAITALPRLNDIGRDKMGPRWHVRRLALIVTGSDSVAIAFCLLTFGGVPQWLNSILYCGFAGMLFTTPGLPPWEQYITGSFREPMPDGSFGKLAAIERKIIAAAKRRVVFAMLAEYGRKLVALATGAQGKLFGRKP
jgi:hypothetical protein